MNLTAEGKAILARTFPEHLQLVSAELRENARFALVTHQLVARIETLEACLRCDDDSVRTSWAREARVRALLQRLWDAVKAYGAIGHEGSELLEVMSEARAELEAGPVARPARLGERQRRETHDDD